VKAGSVGGKSDMRWKVMFASWWVERVLKVVWFVAMVVLMGWIVTQMWGSVWR
jgi:hypothetical protein